MSGRHLGSAKGSFKRPSRQTGGYGNGAGGGGARPYKLLQTIPQADKEAWFWGAGKDHPRQSRGVGSAGLGQHPSHPSEAEAGSALEWDQQALLEASLPVPPLSEGHQSLNTYKACMKYSDCYTGFVSTTMGPKDYMVSNTRCCQSDGCNHGSVPRECQLSPASGLVSSRPAGPAVCTRLLPLTRAAARGNWLAVPLSFLTCKCSVHLQPIFPPGLL